MKTYFPSINFLRGLAAMMVCVFHFFNFSTVWGFLFEPTDLIASTTKLGVNGVFIFFVISGFVIPMSLYKAKFKIIHLHRFLFRRFVRVEIPYLLSIVLILIVSYGVARLFYWPFNFDPFQFLLHIVYLIPFTNYNWYNEIYWTLAIEIQFYLLIALLYLLIKNDVKIIKIGALLAFGLSALLIESHSLVFFYSPIFLLGITSFLIKTKQLNNIEGIALLTLFFGETIWIHSFTIALFSVLTIALIHSAEINNRVTNFFGEISYSLYLLHGLVGGQLLFLLGPKVSSEAGKIGLVVLALICSITAATIFNWMIEKPSQRLSKKIRINKD
ncbi:MAG: acyltransferase [Bacteroidota bacterium]